MAPAVNARTWIPGARSLRRAAAALGLGYGGLCAFGLLGADHLIYLPHAAGYADSPAVLKLPTAHGATISARHDEVPGARFTVLFSHGNAEDLGDVRWFVRRLHGLGISVLSYDYDGYGTSEGTPSEAHLYDDIDAAYAYLTDRLKVPPSRIILYGRSLGSGPTVDLARRRPVAGVILEAAYASIFRVVTRVRIMPWDPFANLSKIRDVHAPILVMHGTGDPLIPIAQGRALFDAAPGPKRSLWVQGAGHANVPFVAGARYEEAIRELVAMIGPPAMR